MDAGELLGMERAEARGHERTPIAALGREAAIAEHVGHQRREHVGDRREAEARLVRLERKPVARQ